MGITQCTNLVRYKVLSCVSVDCFRLLYSQKGNYTLFRSFLTHLQQVGWKNFVFFIRVHLELRNFFSFSFFGINHQYSRSVSLFYTFSFENILRQKQPLHTTVLTTSNHVQLYDYTFSHLYGHSNWLKRISYRYLNWHPLYYLQLRDLNCNCWKICNIFESNDFI